MPPAAILATIATDTRNRQTVCQRPRHKDASWADCLLSSTGQVANGVGNDAIERRVTRMFAVSVRIIAATVVATYECPAVVLGACLIAAMKQVGVEEKCVAGFHLDVN